VYEQLLALVSAHRTTVVIGWLFALEQSAETQRRIEQHWLFGKRIPAISSQAGTAP
jgi:hypothetical protein